MARYTITNYILNGNSSCSKHFLTSRMKHWWNHSVQSMAITHLCDCLTGRRIYSFYSWGHQDSSFGTLHVAWFVLLHCHTVPQLTYPSMLWILVLALNFCEHRIIGHIFSKTNQYHCKWWLVLDGSLPPWSASSVLLEIWQQLLHWHMQHLQ